MKIVNKTNTTIYSLMADLAQKTGSDYYEVILGSTLNEKYRINMYENIGDIPTIKYYGVGLSPVNIVEENELDLYKYKHSATSIDLFRPVPFLARDINVGLTPDEEDIYKMRVTKVINNKTYILCYLKNIDYMETEPTVATFELSEDNNYVMTMYDPDSDGTKATVVDNDSEIFIGASQNVTLALNDVEISNIKYAIELLYPDLTNELVSKYIGEICIYQGIDHKDKNEAIYVQPAYFIQRHFSTDDTEFKYVLNLGGMTPRIFG